MTDAWYAEKFTIYIVISIHYGTNTKIPISKKVELFLLLACDHKNPYADILFNADFVTYKQTKDKPSPE